MRKKKCRNARMCMATNTQNERTLKTNERQFKIVYIETDCVNFGNSRFERDSLNALEKIRGNLSDFSNSA